MGINKYLQLSEEEIENAALELGYSEEEIQKIILKNGLMYAKGIILDRAIPAIDGFKPSQRRVLYAMRRMNLTGGTKAKCSKIAGMTLTFHPHSDVSAYLTSVLMTDNNETYNIPYISGKGTYGKVYSRDLQPAKMRYPESGLSKVGESLFDEIKSGAVDFRPNFDNTEDEPVLLPVKFPTILVNPISGVAVAKSCVIPSFSLSRVCEATCGVIAGKITTPEELAEVLDHPEYSTGGYIHCNKELMTKLCKTGKATFTITGAVECYSDKIIVKEIPFTTTCEEIKDSIVELVNEGTLKEISDIHEGISIKGLKLEVKVKRGYNSREVLEKLYRYTKLRDKISYQIKVIKDNECIDNIGVLDLINIWLEFRHECIIKAQKKKLESLNKEIHEMEAWELINGDIKGVTDILLNNKAKKATELIEQKYGMDELQSQYLVSLRLVDITVDNMVKHIEQVKEKRESIEQVKGLINDPKKRGILIMNQLLEVSNKFGKEEKTRKADILIDNGKELKRKISDEEVVLKITRNGYIKRLIGLNDIMRFECPAGDSVFRTITCRNNEYLLVFTTDGVMHKILVDDIDASRGKVTESIADKLHLEPTSKLLWVDNSGDYRGYFNLVYPNGKGERIYYEKAAGKRMKYISMYPPVQLGNVWVTQEDKFFIITARGSAAYVDSSKIGTFTSRRVFRIARIRSNDRIIGIQPLSRVPDISKIDISKYNKDYTVSIGNDVLWDNKEIERRRQEEKEVKRQREEIAKQQKMKDSMKQIDALLASIEVAEDDYEEY